MQDAAARSRLLDLDRALARLRERHEIAMSAFRFDEARWVSREIVAAETAREQLAARLPPEAPTLPQPARPTLDRVPFGRRIRRRPLRARR